MKNKTIQVTKEVRRQLREYALNGETTNETISRLLKEAKPLSKIDRTTTNVMISESNLDLLKSYKSYETQSHSDTIAELIQSVSR